VTRPKHDETPNVIPFRPRPTPPRAPSRWARSVKVFLVLLAGTGVLRGLYAGMAFGLYDVLFVILLACALTYCEFLARRA